MRYNRLGNTVMNVSHISLGGASFSNIYGSFDEQRSLDFITEALNRGINYIETGPWYGQGSSERTIGKALKGKPRESYYIASKVGRYEKDPAKMFDFSVEKTLAAVDNTLLLLGVEYVDLIQVHDVTFGDVDVILNDTLPALEQVVKDGKARYIGIADYDLDLMKAIVNESEIPISTVLSYAKSTLIDNRVQDYTRYFKRRGVGVINAAATGMGLLCNGGPQSWHPAGDDTKAICRDAAQMCMEKDVELARLASWFSLNQPDIDTHICGFRTVDQLDDTINVLEQGLSQQETMILQELQKRFHGRIPLHWDKVELQTYKAQMAELAKPK
ncbi:L-galactose dehydrogenase-like [Maniola jurtina]|uniref:L-galactose dehydrogenase-like n=1 Tax=Maniola jurtina TaxID=191418 RepID=UPI001E68C061|nr:L-galactose dehydrogenase-like [Maniola jurtina]